MSTGLIAPTLRDAQEASHRFAIDQAALLNADLMKHFADNFDAWKTMVMAGTVPNTNPPQPPHAWIPQQQADGFWYQRMSLLLVCDPRTDIPEDYTKPRGAVVPADGDNVHSVPPGDTTPIGVIITAPDGSRWQRQKSSTPFGTAHFYARV